MDEKIFQNIAFFSQNKNSPKKYMNMSRDQIDILIDIMDAEFLNPELYFDFLENLAETERSLRHYKNYYYLYWIIFKKRLYYQREYEDRKKLVDSDTHPDYVSFEEFCEMFSERE